MHLLAGREKMITKLEVRRKAFHLCLGMIIALLFYNGVIGLGFMALTSFFGMAISFACSRFKIPFISFCLDKFERQKNMKNPGMGIILFFAGCFFAMVLFERDIAIASILILSIGDSFSHIIGAHMGKIKHPWNSAKNMEGSFIGFVLAAMAAYPFAGAAAIAGSFAAMFIESFDLRIGRFAIDDNLTVPIVAGAVIAAFSLL